MTFRAAWSVIARPSCPVVYLRSDHARANSMAPNPSPLRHPFSSSIFFCRGLRCHAELPEGVMQFQRRQRLWRAGTSRIRWWNAALRLSNGPTRPGAFPLGLMYRLVRMSLKVPHHRLRRKPPRSLLPSPPLLAGNRCTPPPTPSQMKSLPKESRPPPMRSANGYNKPHAPVLLYKPRPSFIITFSSTTRPRPRPS